MVRIGTAQASQYGQPIVILGIAIPFSVKLAEQLRQLVDMVGHDREVEGAGLEASGDPAGGLTLSERQSHGRAGR